MNVLLEYIELLSFVLCISKINVVLESVNPLHLPYIDFYTCLTMGLDFDLLYIKSDNAILKPIHSY